ncbi:MAG: hypothetical protein ABL898_13075 [Hyphomicrobiaceae bacterium]|nr:hypothetical protein [Hyphomicrobiaceae bacterium]
MTALTSPSSKSLLNLRNVLWADTASCAGSALVMILGGSWLTTLTALPQSLTLWSGLMLIPIAAFIAWVATRTPIPMAGVWLIIVGNVGWVLASVVVAIAVKANGLGTTFVLAQAAVVAVLAWLEYAQLKNQAT